MKLATTKAMKNTPITKYARGKQPEMVQKGVMAVRKSNSDWGVHVYTGMMKKLLQIDAFNRPEKLMECIGELREEFGRLLRGEVPVQELVLTKRLSKAEYKNPNEVHFKVVQRWKRMRPGSEPHVGDRVPYVITVDKGDKAGDKARPVFCVTEGTDVLDYGYYLEHELKNPVSKVLETFLEKSHVRSLFDVRNYSRDASIPGLKKTITLIDTPGTRALDAKATAVRRMKQVKLTFASFARP